VKKLGYLASGELVVDRTVSHIHPGLDELLAPALDKIVSHGRERFVEEVNFGWVIGETHCVTTTPDDKIIYAQRENRSGLSRFAPERKPEPCTAVTVVLWKSDEGYVLRTAFVGYMAEPEPWDKNATEASVPFWNTHALVPEGNRIVLETATLECPW
jgi:hypothetical protein